jgi:hypothetical protein
VKKKDVFEGKREDTVTDEFRRYSTADSAISATEKFNPIT